MTKCRVRDCTAPAYCRGLCSRCYQYDLRRGSRLASARKLPGAKLTKAKIQTIRKLRSEGGKLKVLAARFQVSETAIYMAVTGRTWGDLKTT